jgi:prepilin-type N-terminal cleavage/methylation domain-containing protein
MKRKICKKIFLVSGFTLIELIVVIGILAVLAIFLIAIVNPFEQYKKANDARRKSDLGQIQRALEAYYQDYGRYPENDTNYQIRNAPWGSGWPPYMNVVPKDTGSRRYVYVSSGQMYYLYASLERGSKDPQTCKRDGSKCDNAPVGFPCGSGGEVCNYGVSSPNTSP